MVRFGNRSLSLYKVVAIVLDMGMVFVALALALQLRFDFVVPAQHVEHFLTIWPMYLGVNALIYFTLGFYDQIWRFASIRQYLLIFFGTLIQPGFLGVTAALRLTAHPSFPRSVYIIYWLLSFILIVGLRIVYRVLANRTSLPALVKSRLGLLHVTAGSGASSSSAQNSLHGSGQAAKAHRPAPEPVPPRRVMVIGAGSAGSQLIRELQHNRQGRTPVVIIDDNHLTHTYRVLGVPVYGDRHAIPAAAEKYQVQEIILAIPSAPRQEIREIVEIASRTGCELKIIPALYELIDGQVSLKDIKEVEIEDLLGRDEIVLDTAAIAGYLRGETVLVTGGGGSIGSELCRQIARFQPARLVVFDIYENNAYQLQYELQGLYGDALELKILIGSVRDKLRLDKVFAEYQPGVVFHAAAHKHVPLMEDSPGEAVKNNIFGTFNVAETAARHGARHVVLISTDKAVNPTNVMGATKRIAELLVQTLSIRHPATKFAAVRFGNVLGSNGSVIPLFKQQIKNERKVTVTHPEITRYFMTIPEAARLVIQAGSLAQGGEIFVLDMGQPVKIVDLARELIRLSGLEPERDVEIVFTGLRPGEKMYEELYLDKESLDLTRHEKIFQLRPVRDGAILAHEITQLQRIIRWENGELKKLLGWIGEQYPTTELAMAE